MSRKFVAKTRDYLQMQKDLAAWLSTCADLKTAASDALSQLIWIDNIDYARLLLATSDGALGLLAEDGRNELGELAHFSTNPGADLFLRETAAQNNPVYLSAQEIAAKKERCIDARIRSAAVIPLKFGGETEALLCALSFSVDDIPLHVRDVLESVAGMLTTVIARLQADAARKYSEQRFEDVALASSDWIWEIDKDQRYTFATSKIKELLGYNPEEIIGKTPFELLKAEEAERLAMIFNLVMSPPPREIRNLETWTTARDGRPVCIQTNGKPILNEAGALIGYRGVDTDITKRKLAEQALKAAKEAAEAANEAKSQFLANMSHEIRTPMNGVIGILDLLARTELNEKQSEYITLARHSGNHLLDIINEILDFSKLKSMKSDIRPADFLLHPTILDAVTMLEERGRKKGITVSVAIASDVPTAVVGDQRRVRQILINLVGNAIKFTDKGSVLVGVSAVHPDSYSVLVTFRIVDSGIGIPEDKQSTLFDPFVQVDSSYSRRHEGSGLGLAIVKELVSLMKGDLSLSSVPGKGTTFTVTLPFVKLPDDTVIRTVSSIAAARSRSVSALSGQPRVLVVEDNEINLIVTMDMLKELGCIVRSAGNGQEALAVLSKAQFDLVLMDCQMPVMDGYEATTRIRADEKLKLIPIVALTAHATHDDRDKALSAGMDDYLSKPITSKNLRKMIEIFISVPKEIPDEIKISGPKTSTLSVEPILDPDTVRSDKLVGLFLSFIPQYLLQLADAAAKPEAAEIAAAAHKIKGSCLSFGARKMTPLCMAIESAGKANDLEHISALIESLNFEFSQVKDALGRNV
jgi:PAS domain S-box-containing protein